MRHSRVVVGEGECGPEDADLTKPIIAKPVQKIEDFTQMAEISFNKIQNN